MADTSALFHRDCGARYPTALRGEGCWLIDAEGRRYLDGSGGAAVSCLGHSHEGVRRALHEQVDRLAFAHSGFFTTDPAEALAERLVAHAPPGIERAYLVSGGSEAVEAAIKLARQYFLEVGQPERRRLIARRQSYHGNTLGALAAGGNEWRRRPFAPLLAETSHIAPCYAYRDRGPDETPEAYGRRVAGELEAELERLDPGTVMAFLAEPVVGATLGAVPPVPGYFARIREICDAHGILLILDEVMCGMGRTGTLFASEQEGTVPGEGAAPGEGITPDIVTIAKGLGAGYQPVGAMLCTGAVHDAIAAGSGAFRHGHTYLAHPLAAAAGGAVLSALLDDGVLGRVAPLGERLADRLAEALGDHPHVGDIRGRGLFRGVELVADRDARAPFDPGHRVHARLKAAAMEEGLVCYPMGGTVDGRRGDHVLLAPPFVIEPAEIDELVARLARAVEVAVAVPAEPPVEIPASDARRAGAPSAPAVPRRARAPMVAPPRPRL